MEKSNNNIKIRKDYSKIKSVEIIPSLIEMQKVSYDKFLQKDIKDRLNIGLQSVFNSSFPICSDDGKFILEFVEYYFDEPKYSQEESKKKGTTYALPLKIKLRLTTNDIDKETGSVAVKDIKEQDIFLADVPLMSDSGTFVVNGTERVVVSQIYRSPGVFFDSDKGKNNAGKEIYSASIIPHIGSWLDFEFDNKDLLYVKIDKRKKIPLIYFLKSLENVNTSRLKEQAGKDGKVLDFELVKGMDNEEILDTFYHISNIKRENDNFIVDFAIENYEGRKLDFDLVNASDNSILVKKGTLISKGLIKKLSREEVSKVILPLDELIGTYLAKDIVIDNNNTLYAGEQVNEDILDLLKKRGINEFGVIVIDDNRNSNYIINSLLIDREASYFKSLNEIYKTVKLSDAPNVEVANELIDSLFFQSNRYNLSNVGRMKINEKFGLDIPEDFVVLSKQDIITVIKYLLDVRTGKKEIDDIDHLGNRRVRSVGELVENEIRIAFVRMERFIKEKMVTLENIMPNEILNVRSIQSAFKDFFGTSQLSQFMDQTNPLSEVTHKRRLSALGPKGLTRERASFEVRDVHLTHYGRICPIETPEGPNIGLINSLATYAKVNSYGFLETPYRKVVDSVVMDEIVYMTATQETDHVIAQAASLLDINNKFTEELVSCRINGELTLCKPEEITYIDISPKQLVSVAASLVPFLETDDANRALMGANMQRQAVPLLKAEAPIVGTGMESVVAKNSGVVILANRSGFVHKVTSEQIVIKAVNEETKLVYDIDIYNLRKFQRSNANTCINQKPIVNVGDFVKKGDVIADGQSIDNGELALGKNVLVGFMPWNGYNYEDSILISENVVKDDVFTSIHIEEFEVVARDTKLGPEEITADIPNVSEDAIKHIDESGVVYIGAEVKAGDILVGKVTPKAESVISAEEKLLRAIFGEKATDVKDTSLKVPSGITGTVIDVRVFSRRGLEKDDRTQLIERNLIEGFTREKEEEINIMQTAFVARAVVALEGQEVVSAKSFNKGYILKAEDLKEVRLSDLFKIIVKDKGSMNMLLSLTEEFNNVVEKLNEKFEAKVASLYKGDELPSGALKMVKVFVAVKRKLQPGDKMAGRHGNKGVVSKILPIEDMPYLEDGTPLDICLNPLGVPSRMNVGQVLEVHLGWGAANVGKRVNQMVDNYYNSKDNIEDIRSYLLRSYGEAESETIKNLNEDQIIELAKSIKKGMPVATSVFDGVKEKDINNLLADNDLETSGQVTLIDGRTGKPFERKVTVGYIYILKLHHLVDEKIHARSIGPYSLITQQPLGGKAQFGGQRFGEMEVWALEAYGAAYILREMLTIKSDDQAGRTYVYESIIKGENTFNTGIPESFNVLIKELRSLCLNLELKNKEEQEVQEAEVVS